MRISEVGVPRVCLSSDVACEESSEELGFVAVNVPVKIEDRTDEDGPMVAQARLRRGRRLEGKTIENRSSAGWLLFKIPRDLCPEGGALVFRALVDQVVLWQKEYRVVWHGRFPALEPAAQRTTTITRWGSFPLMKSCSRSVIAGGRALLVTTTELIGPLWLPRYDETTPPQKHPFMNERLQRDRGLPSLSG